MRCYTKIVRYDAVYIEHRFGHIPNYIHSRSETSTSCESHVILRLLHGQEDRLGCTVPGEQLSAMKAEPPADGFPNCKAVKLHSMMDAGRLLVYRSDAFACHLYCFC